MDEQIVYVVPYIAIAIIALASAFGTDNWPEWLTNLCIFNATMANGLWASGVVGVGLIFFGVPFGVAALIGLPVAYVVGRMIVRR